MMKATNKFPLEISVIHGTLRNQDLIPAFLEAVLQLDPDTPIPEELREAPQDNDDHEWWYTETAYWVLEHLDNKLNDHAPDGYYFGAHYGDGSDFGFWRMIDEEDDGQQDRDSRVKCPVRCADKKDLAGESESEKFRFWQEGKSEMLRLLAKRHNMRVVDITINGQKVLHKSKSVAEIKQFRRTT
jgi:hypothetical protein